MSAVRLSATSMRRRGGPIRGGKRRWLASSVVAASVLITLAAAELVFRTYLPVRGLTYQLDDRYLFSYIPGSHKIVTPAGLSWPKVLVRINEHGRRGDESAYPQADHRLIVYGDSFVAAEYTPERETYVRQLEQILNAGAPRTSVLNAGVTGYGVDQQALRIEDEMASLQPHLVIVTIYAGNDSGDLLRNKLYRLDATGHLQRNTPVIGDAVRRQFASADDLSPLHVIRALQTIAGRRASGAADPSDLSASPATARDPTTRHLMLRREEYEAYVVRRDDVVVNILADGYDADVALEPLSSSARYKVRLMEQLIEHLRQVVASRRTRLLLVIVPEHCDVDPTCAISAVRRQYPGYTAAGLSDTFESIARGQGVVAVNLYEAFRANGGSALYYESDGHWKPQGQALAAKLVADAIVAGKLLVED